MTGPKNEPWWSRWLGYLLIVVLGLFMVWGLLTSLGFEFR